MSNKQGRDKHSDTLILVPVVITLGAGGAFRIFIIYIGAENVRRRQIFMVALVILIKICNYCPITDIEEGFASLHV